MRKPLSLASLGFLTLALSNACTTNNSQTEVPKVVVRHNELSKDDYYDWAGKTSIRLYNNTSSDSIIGEPKDSYQGYVQAQPWSTDGPYVPKFFDLQIVAQLAYDSMQIEMNIANITNGKVSKDLLTKNITVLPMAQSTGRSLLTKNIAFENIYNSYPDLKQINFYFTIYRNDKYCSFAKSFNLHEDEGILAE